MRADRRVHWALQPCRCAIGCEGQCLSCRRWMRHFEDVLSRRHGVNYRGLGYVFAGGATTAPGHRGASRANSRSATP